MYGPSSIKYMNIIDVRALCFQQNTTLERREGYKTTVYWRIEFNRIILQHFCSSSQIITLNRKLVTTLEKFRFNHAKSIYSVTKL